MLGWSIVLVLGPAACLEPEDAIVTDDGAEHGKADDLEDGEESPFDNGPLLIEADTVVAALGPFSDGFCARARQNLDPDDAYGTRLGNAAWLAAMSANEYAGFAQMGPFLAELGFGNPDFRGLRIDGEGGVTADGAPTDEGDWWAEQGKLGAEVLRDEGAAAFGQFKSTLLQQPRDSQWIQFFTAGQPNAEGFETESAQVVFARHLQANVIIVAFRGTQADGEHIEDLLADADGRLTSFGDEGWGRTHNGFTKSLDSVWEPLWSKIMASQTGPIDERPAIWITGHSLGAALATIFTARLVREMNDNPELWLDLRGLYTFGSPRVGTTHFENELEFWSRGCGRAGPSDPVCIWPPVSVEDGNYDVQLVRFRLGHDLVSQIPPVGISASWKHVGRQVMLVPDHPDAVWFKPASEGTDARGFPPGYVVERVAGDEADPNDGSGNVPLLFRPEADEAVGASAEEEMSRAAADDWRSRWRLGSWLSDGLRDHDIVTYYERLAASALEDEALAACGD